MKRPLTHASILLASLPALFGIEFPYEADEKRRNSIEKGISNVAIGMTAADLIEALGRPDRVTPLYEPKVFKPKQIGYTYWYLLSQQKEKGSVLEKQIHGFAIRTTLAKEVYDIHFFEPPDSHHPKSN